MHSASTALCFLVALAAGSEGMVCAESPAEGQYAVEAKLVTVPEAEAGDIPQDGVMSDADLGVLTQRPQAHVMAFPSVTSPMESLASVAHTQPMLAANGVKQDVGPSLEVKALADGRFHVTFHTVDFLGYKEPAAIHPRFRSHGVSRNIQPVLVADAGFSLIDVAPHSDPPVLYDAGGRVQDSATKGRQRLLLFVKITRG